MESPPRTSRLRVESPRSIRRARLFLSLSLSLATSDLAVPHIGVTMPKLSCLRTSFVHPPMCHPSRPSQEARAGQPDEAPLTLAQYENALQQAWTTHPVVSTAIPPKLRINTGSLICLLLLTTRVRSFATGDTNLSKPHLSKRSITSCTRPMAVGQCMNKPTFLCLDQLSAVGSLVTAPVSL